MLYTDIGPVLQGALKNRHECLDGNLRYKKCIIFYSQDDFSMYVHKYSVQGHF